MLIVMIKGSQVRSTMIMTVIIMLIIMIIKGPQVNLNFVIPQVMRGYRGRREETEQTIQDQWSAFKSLLELLISTFCKMSHIDNVIVHIYFFLLGFNVAKSTKIGLTEFV